MICPNCGQEIKANAKFCPECGAPQAMPPQAQAFQDSPAPQDVSPAQEKLQAERIAYVRKDYDPLRDGRPNAATRSVSPAVPVGPAVPAGPAASGGTPSTGSVYGPAQMEPRPPTTGMVVFSIINMLCCGLGIGFILGVIALIFSIMAAGDNNLAEARHKIRTARILNIIGLVCIIVQAVLFFVFLAIILLITSSDSNFSFFNAILPIFLIG